MSWADVRLIATRELRFRAADKGFIASVVVTLVIVLALAVLPGLLSSSC